AGRDLQRRPFRPVVVVPTYDNPLTIERVALEAREHVPGVIVVDDGGGPAAQEALQRLAAHEGVTVLHRATNGGKGAAVKDGLRWAAEAGYTHALQVDADGQHDLGDVPRLLVAAREAPGALVLGQPVFDESAPGHRRVARKLSIFWVNVATALDRGRIADPMCGYRVYPIADAVAVMDRCGDRMDFDPEIAVRLVWRGCPVVHVPTKVRYVPEEEGGVSHFLAFTDNALVSLLFARLFMLRFLGLSKSL
ncbi:MAG TPA: glycosyltransferase family 2 protein, partial [Polyangiaceae bacterium LLY-WYZ-15_(1-7)]|nr:glycosyltransferase family 2 protein [Polyangiaceae bacterium LLY-WYZ-15_(1-7)]